jgi:hypothetical protein
MTIPALLVDFPPAGLPGHAERAHLLGRQWPLCWSVGKKFFRFISTLGLVGYAYTAYAVYKAGPRSSYNWKIFAVAAGAHLATVIHSAVNMQPMNDKLEALAGRATDTELLEAEPIARKWAKWNLVRLATPVLAGTLALWQSLV